MHQFDRRKVDTGQGQGHGLLIDRCIAACINICRRIRRRVHDVFQGISISGICIGSGSIISQVVRIIRAQQRQKCSVQLGVKPVTICRIMSYPK